MNIHKYAEIPFGLICVHRNDITKLFQLTVLHINFIFKNMENE